MKNLFIFTILLGVGYSSSIECWGSDSYGQSTPPSGTFTDVAAGYYHTCGIDDSGSIECWGRNNNGQSTPPSGTFTDVALGYQHTCGIICNNAVVDCTGVCGGEDTSCVDCLGIPWGDAEEDCNGVCEGEDTSCVDCAGVPNGSNVVDDCGTCDSDSSNDCVQDCSGTWGGSLVDDECGVCGGDGDGIDCNDDGIPDDCEEVYDTGYDIGAESGDANLDGQCNILDIVYLVDQIVNGVCYYFSNSAN